MDKHRLIKFYRVFKNDTAVTEASFNDFKPPVRRGANELKPATQNDFYDFQHTQYSLPPDSQMYYGYEQKAHAMEKAKAGALRHIAALIAEGPVSVAKVYRYRFDHYEDLNIHLRDSNIRLLKSNI